MAERPVNANQRRIYVMMRTQQIRVESNELKAKLAAKPQPGAMSGEASKGAHREYIFARLRLQELRKELAALKKERLEKPKAKTIDDFSDL
jgi:hypothetical protein